LRNYNLSLVDDIGNLYERKNTYLLQLAQLQDQCRHAHGETLKNLKNEKSLLIKQKSVHPYRLAIKAFKKDELGFKVTLKEKLASFNEQLPKAIPKKHRQMEKALFIAKENVAFYASYRELSYDAMLIHDQSAIKVKLLPDIIENYKQLQIDLQTAKQQLVRIDPKQEVQVKESLQAFKIEQKHILREGLSALSQKRKSGLISAKALLNGRIELRRKYKESVKLKSYESQKKHLKELIANKKYLLSTGIQRQLKVLKSNLSDVRRHTPIETEKTLPFTAFVTAALPGVGQLINRQFLKAALFFAGSFFIYFIAIPYALGYGNYQGEGLSGLISLAEGGRRIDKSIIFMIEGIVAIFLMLFAIAIYAFSAVDVYKVEKDLIKGIRQRTWFETAVKIEQEGFPYLVSIPALIVTVFIVLVPITTAILLSFAGMDPQHQSKFGWEGFKNYQLIVTGQGLAGSVFWAILQWTLIWTLASTTLAILTGFSLAIIANNERIIGKTFFRVVYLLPWAVPAFITIMFFSIMFSPSGALTTLIKDIFDIQVNIKNDAVLSRITLILLQTWLGSSYVFLLSTGVLQAIPEDLYEAAQIDGATDWQKLRRITVPLVLFQTAPLLVGQYTFNFNNFSIIYLFNQGGPFNPSRYGNLAGSTDLLISYIYKLTMDNQYQSIGAAITIVISLGLMIFAFIGFKNSKAFKEERL
jgi:arabinogalactan oligomer/maltooligosaccharide transport system permease protein